MFSSITFRGTLGVLLLPRPFVSPVLLVVFGFFKTFCTLGSALARARSFSAESTLAALDLASCAVYGSPGASQTSAPFQASAAANSMDSGSSGFDASSGARSYIPHAFIRLHIRKISSHNVPTDRLIYSRLSMSLKLYYINYISYTYILKTHYF